MVISELRPGHVREHLKYYSACVLLAGKVERGMESKDKYLKSYGISLP